jgi:DNA replication protein DnaC
MRHDPASGAIIIMLRSLKMHGMAQAVTDLMEQGAPAFDAAVPMLAQLLKAEVAEREVRSIAYHMKAARFPAYKDLSGFDFAASEINEATVRQLHRCEFMDGAQNVVLIGGPGTGKTHVATALGVQAVEHHRRQRVILAPVRRPVADFALNPVVHRAILSQSRGLTPRFW